jgi:hypothetical protein
MFLTFPLGSHMPITPTGKSAKKKYQVREICDGHTNKEEFTIREAIKGLGETK